MNAKDLIIDALVDLYQNGPRDRELGICYHVCERTACVVGTARTTQYSMVILAMRELFTRWPEFSGSVTYPVPGPKGQAPDAAFHAHGDMWSDDYGARRWALAEFMLRELCK